MPLLYIWVIWCSANHFGFKMGFNPDVRQFMMDKMFDRANLTMARWKNPHEIKALIQKVKSAHKKGVEATEEIEKFNGYVKDCGDAFTYFREQANAAEEIWVEIKNEVEKKRFCIQLTDGVVFFLGRPCTGWFVYLIWARLTRAGNEAAPVPKSNENEDEDTTGDEPSDAAPMDRRADGIHRSGLVHQLSATIPWIPLPDCTARCTFFGSICCCGTMLCVFVSVFASVDRYDNSDAEISWRFDSMSGGAPFRRTLFSTVKGFVEELESYSTEACFFPSPTPGHNGSSSNTSSTNGDACFDFIMESASLDDDFLDDDDPNGWDGGQTYIFREVPNGTISKTNLIVASGAPKDMKYGTDVICLNGGCYTLEVTSDVYHVVWVYQVFEWVACISLIIMLLSCVIACCHSPDYGDAVPSEEVPSTEMQVSYPVRTNTSFISASGERPNSHKYAQQSVPAPGNESTPAPKSDEDEDEDTTRDEPSDATPMDPRVDGIHRSGSVHQLDAIILKAEDDAAKEEKVDGVAEVDVEAKGGLNEKDEAAAAIEVEVVDNVGPPPLGARAAVALDTAETAAAWRAFQKFDVDGDLVLTRAELAAAFEFLGVSVTAELEPEPNPDPKHEPEARTPLDDSGAGSETAAEGKATVAGIGASANDGALDALMVTFDANGDGERSWTEVGSDGASR